MKTELSPRAIGRLAALFLIGGGLLTAVGLLLPQPPGVHSGPVTIVAAAALTAGVATYVAPWDRWHRRASLVLVPVALALIAVGNFYSSFSLPYTYALFIVVTFVWIGVGHGRGASALCAPLATVAYVLPMILRHNAVPAATATTLIAIPVCVLVGESLAWISARERSNREAAHALTRSSQSLGRHLSEHALSQSLVEEARSVLRAEHAILFQLDPEKSTVTDVFASGVQPEAAQRLSAARGSSYKDLPRFDAMAEGTPIVVEDVAGSPDDEDLLRYNIKSYIAMPVMAADELVGILWSAQTAKRRRYRPGDLALASAFAGQASAAFQNARLYERTLEASRSDPLTGLANRRVFHEQLSSEVARARRHGRSVALTLADIDSLKRLNDSFGHVAGDRVLQHLAAVLRRESRTEDSVYRIGGDEFALILPDTDTAEATIVAERLRRAIDLERMAVGESLTLTVSVGIASYSEHAVNADELYERADSALYEGKRTGGNAVAIASVEETTGPGVRLGVDVSEIIRTEALNACYQPIFCLENGSAIGYECFSRLDPGKGFMPTHSLFRAAAALGLTEELDAACRRVALQGVRVLLPSFLLFLNVAPATIASPRFSAAQILDPILSAGLVPNQIVIELTEQERPASSPYLQEGLSDCRSAGLKVALDDFGAAGTDLNLLAQIPFDYVKIDPTFVHDVAGDATRSRVLSGMSKIARESGAQVIAEGVETDGDLQLVHDLGFHAAQGFMLSHMQRRLDSVRIDPPLVEIGARRAARALLDSLPPPPGY